MPVLPWPSPYLSDATKLHLRVNLCPAVPHAERGQRGIPVALLCVEAGARGGDCLM